MGVYLGLEQRSLALIASRRDDRASEPALRLVAAYGLTHAEAQVARLLAEGLSLREIALSRETAYNTVRGQVKTVADKLSVRRQAEIVRAVCQIL